MKFLFPSFLFALFAVLIPIIIHLFNFRRFKTVYFSNVRFLKEVKEETASRSKVKHLLVLLCRMLAIAFLVLAFAQPFIPTKENVNLGSKAISVYIDNSFSMNAVGEDMPLLEQAKRIAEEIGRTYGDETGFHILTNDFEGKHQRIINKDEFLSFVDDIESTPSVKPLSEVVNRQKDILSREAYDNLSIYVLSDFQKNITDIEPDTGISYNLWPLQSVAESNVYIDSVWFNAPIQLLNQQNQLIVQIKNKSNQSVEDARLTLEINGETKAITDYTVQAKSISFDTVNFTITDTGWNEAKLAIGDYPIVFDDAYYVTFNVVEQIQVLVVSQDKTTSYLKAWYENETIFNTTYATLGNLDYSSITSNQLVVLDNLRQFPSGLSTALEKFTNSGGNTVIFPSGQANTSEYNSFLQSVGSNVVQGTTSGQLDITYINTEEAIFNDVFDYVPQNISLPYAKSSFNYSQRSNTNEEVLLRLKNGASFLSKYTFGNGRLYLFATPLDKNYTDLPTHGIFVPLMYKLGITGIQTNKLSYTIKPDTRIEVRNSLESAESIYKIRGEEIDFIPEQRPFGSSVLLGLQGQVKEAGIYEVYQEQLEEKDMLAALNFDRKESDLVYISAKQLEEMYDANNVSIIESTGQGVGQIVDRLDNGIALWKLCIIFALVFLAIEILLLRLLPN